MLKHVNLDDTTFSELVAAAGITIEEWSDRNAHDPGIMLIEMFAWLTEMQRFYINNAEIPVRAEIRAAAAAMGDYEELVSKFPGVESVRAYPSGRHSVNIAVSGNVGAGDILSYLEPYRLIGTEITIVKPNFVNLKITAEIRGQPFREDIKPIIGTNLLEFLETRHGGFGTRLSKDEVIEFLSSLEVVEEVIALELKCEGTDVKRDIYGNIALSPCSILRLKGFELYVH